MSLDLIYLNEAASIWILDGVPHHPPISLNHGVPWISLVSDDLALSWMGFAVGLVAEI